MSIKFIISYVERVLTKWYNYFMDKKINWIAVVISISIIVLMAYNIGRSITQTAQKLEIIKYAQEEVEQLRLENIKLIMEKEKMRKDDFIELEARNRLNYARSGDTVAIFSRGLVEKSEFEPTISTNLECDQLCIINEWIGFFKDGL